MSWASLLAQLVKNLPAMQETWVRAYISERKGKKKTQRDWCGLSNSNFMAGGQRAQRIHTAVGLEVNRIEKINCTQIFQDV